MSTPASFPTGDSVALDPITTVPAKSKSPSADPVAASPTEGNGTHSVEEVDPSKQVYAPLYRVSSQQSPVLSPCSSNNAGVSYPTTATEMDTGMEKEVDAGLRRRWRRKRFWIPVTITAVLGIGLGAGLGIGLRPGHEPNVRPNSGVVWIDSGNITDRRISMFFHHTSGQIRHSLFHDDVWSGGTSDSPYVVVASDVRSSSPVMALQYVDEAELRTRVIYIDSENYLAESLSSNETSEWSSTQLRGGKSRASSSDNAGLSACINYQYYSSNAVGLRLYYGSEEGNIKELIWKLGRDAWDRGHTFPNSNGEGGVECTVRSLDTTYVWLLNEAGQLELRWYDFNTTTNSTWTTGVTHDGPRNNSAVAAIQVGGTRFVHYVDNDNNVQQLETVGEAGNLTFTGPPSLVDRAVEGIVKLSAVVIETGRRGGQEIHVIFMKYYGVFTDFNRVLDSNSWTPTNISIGE